MIVAVSDLNPGSILKEIENTNQIEKYMMSEETYDQLPDNFRKWKHQFLIDNPHVKQSLSGQPEICDPEYMGSVAATLAVGMRCQLENGARGEIRYVGKAMEIGYGYFVGVLTDEEHPGLGDGTLNGNYYFQATLGHAHWDRPNKVEIGDFPKIEESDEI